MGLRIKVLVCFSLLVLLLVVMILSNSSSSSDVGFAKFGSFKTGFASENSPVSSSEGFVGSNKDVNGDGYNDSSFGDEKRRIHTGPNPLHNR
ncbi:hypothetical protein L484_013548 [Morus notabilis]|uniref:Uncharacterized protein n=1 Tax=Morus notabilis TaxID=981085 RepID=W9QH32_9ROSA|nr:hypothetical protein L484_013548 [Morus notabilis]